MTIILNTPNCPSCSAGVTLQNSGLAPYYAVDAGSIAFTAGVTATVIFVNIRNLTSASQWVMPRGKALNAYGSEIFPTITKTTTGFTILADEAGTYDYFCIKI